VHRPARSAALVLAAVGALLLTGCGSGSDDSTAEAPAALDGGASAGDADEAGAPPASAEAPADGAADARARIVVASDAVVRTAELGVRVDDLRAAADRAGAVAREAGGTVSSERVDSAVGDGRYANAELVLRVPPERFDDVLSRLASLGEERNRTVGTEEVGDQLVDLESRLAAQRASVERVRALLAEAEDLGQVVTIESELTRRTADLESL
jgi:hypothetical protein